ncbi:EF-P 5-aminopentanol modification-associated protein YfmH [Streptococcus didelphis]|uniref:EF-P 5-aminopentanol modification-associated protein YfmH n=1 Tax=Streptococcus didelphis TaxID=102886 RepID=UPI000376A5E1|nr:pitrilysin family protein [Streptococcus didelphis]
MNTLKKINYSRFDEEFYYSKFRNDFQVYIINKPGFVEKTAMLTVNYGSLDNNFTIRGKQKENTEGIAHFLEHKLFEDAQGNDISLKFTNLGADVNAFTTFDKTSYYFSSSNNFIKNLNLLQEFVMTATFTDSSVNREKKIIAQEIDMYLDDPDYRSYSGILQNLFPGSSLAMDIAGSKESIEMISAEILRKNYNQFYHPSQMTLFIVGEVDVEETFESIKLCQANFKRRKPAKAAITSLPYNEVIKTNSLSMDINIAKVAVGYRGAKCHSNNSLLAYRIALKFLLAMLFGWTSKNYQNWYDSGKIDDSFDIEIEIHHDYSFVIITLDSSQPISMSSKIRKEIEEFQKSKDINSEHLALLKREMYGDFLQSLDSIEHICNQFNMFLTSNDNYFDIPTIIEQVTLEDIISVGKDFFAKAEVSDFMVFPK